MALVIVGILSALAYPSYRAHVMRAHRLEAIEALLAVAAAQERFHLAYGRYADGFSVVDGPGLRLPPVTAGGRYDLALSTSGPADFVARATPRPGSGQDEDERCFELAIHADGRRHAASRQGADTTQACWG